jgi:peptidoglycan/LPS O-acetylase OafA/YrhL
MLPKAPSHPKRSGSLDLLRFLAVLIVYFAHYSDTFNTIYQIVPANLKYVPVFRYGPAALIIFFMVSGYVVTMTSIKRNIREFTITRLSRIYPLFWLSCLTAFIVARIFPTHSYLAITSLKVFLVNLTMVAPFFGAPNLNPVFHTLVMELMFYLFIGLIISFKLWNRVLLILLCLMLFCTYQNIAHGIGLSNIISPFAAGMLFYFLKSGYGDKWKIFGLLSFSMVLTFMCGQTLAADALSRFHDGYGINLSIFYVLVLAIYTVFYLIAVGKIDIKGRKAFQILGEIAYPFYLFHIYFLAFYWYFKDKVNADLLLISIALIIALFSWALNVYVEKPLSNWAVNILSSIKIKKPIRKTQDHTAPGF